MSDDKKNYGQQFLALMNKLTKVDGRLSPIEEAWLKRLQSELGEDSVTQSDFDPQVLKTYVENKGEAEELLTFLLLVGHSDGILTSSEWALIQEMAELVGVDKVRLEEMRAETVLIVEP